MVYLNSEMGQAIGRLIREAQTPSEVILTSDSLVIRLGVPASTVGTENAAYATKRRKYGKIEFDGVSLTTKEWAEKLGVKKNTIQYRMKKYGNPFGKEKPTDEDAVILSSVEA